MKLLISLSLLILTWGFWGHSTTSAGSFACKDGKTYPVSLTFDDGPHPVLTQKVLEILKKKKIEGTFFVLGDNFATEAQRKQNYPILQKMRNEGHTIGSHTYSHIMHSKVPIAEARRNISKATELLKDYLNPVLRLPYGDGAFHSDDPEKQKKNDQVMASVREGGFTHVRWNIDTNDWDPKKRDHVLPSMMSQICSQKGGIILFHDIQPNTVKNLERWIDAIRAEGHTIVGLPHFVPQAARKYEPNPVCNVTPDQKNVQELDSLIDRLRKQKDEQELDNMIEKLRKKRRTQ